MKKRVHQHETHDDIARRLKRAKGHISKIIEMIERQRSCLDIAQQLYAVEKAVTAAKKTLIHDHIDHCLEAAGLPPGDQRAPVDEFKQITKYL